MRKMLFNYAIALALCAMLFGLGYVTAANETPARADEPVIESTATVEPAFPGEESTSTEVLPETVVFPDGETEPIETTDEADPPVSEEPVVIGEAPATYEDLLAENAMLFEVITEITADRDEHEKGELYWIDMYEWATGTGGYDSHAPLDPSTEPERPE